MTVLYFKLGLPIKLGKLMFAIVKPSFYFEKKGPKKIIRRMIRV